MRNFGNESFVSQHHHQQHYHNPYHQLIPPSSLPPSIHQQLGTIPPAIKMEPYPLTKTIGVGANLKHMNKSHFSPVSIVAPSQHDHHDYPGSVVGGAVGHHNSSGGGTNSRDGGAVASTSNNNNSVVPGIPINLSHPHQPQHHQHQQGHHHPNPTSGTLVSSSTPGPTVESHLPTAALAATCPTTANRGPSPAHQQIPVNGSPYHHPSHSPTLPVAHTALPSEIHGSMIPSTASTATGTTNRSSPSNQTNPDPNPAYHLAPVTSFNKIQSHNNALNSKIGKSAGGGGDNQHHTTSHSPNPPTSNPSNPTHHHGSSSTVKSETNPSLPPTTPVPNNGNGSNSPTSSSSSTGGTSTTASAATAARIVSQNVNGTLAITGIPTNESELQLFRVLQRANLLSYFDMMIELGGDDVQQLCEAGEEEFLEIMALIGMAAKPLHVRRLQKALQEWMTQPSLFQSPVLPPGFQHQYGVSQVDHTISHTQYTTTTIGTAATSNVPGGIGNHQPLPVIPLPHLISHNPVSPYLAQSAPTTTYTTTVDGASANNPNSSDTCSKTDPQSKNAKPLHQPQLLDRSNNNISPSLANGLTTATVGGLHGPYIQQGSPLIPVVISTGQTYNSGQAQQSSNLSSCSTVTTADSYRNCVSPSGSTTSNSSTVSIRSHHHHQHHHQFHPHQNHPSSPMENYPSSPANSESSGRSSCYSNNSKTTKQEEPTTSSELENASSSDQTNSIQSLDNSSGTGSGGGGMMRVASRSGSSCGGGSEPSSPGPPTISSSSPALPPSLFSKGGMLISSSQRADSPRSSSESVANRNNNSVTFPSSSAAQQQQHHHQSQDFSSLQEHEIQKLAETAMTLVRSLPPHVNEPKVSRKIETSSYEMILRMADDDPRKMEEIRRMSTIFGKSVNGDTPSSKRSKSNNHNSTSSSTSKSVSVLELAMNEAAAQLCRFVPALLTKRDEMYNLARQVIRDSGLPYSVICANSNLPSSFFNNNNNNNSNNNNNIDVVSTERHERSKGKIDEIRNSPAHEERISNEFAAACKKIKLDMNRVGVQELNGYNGVRKNGHGHTTENGMHITEIHNLPRRKSPSREHNHINHVQSTALKKMALATSEFRNNSNKSSSVSIRT